MVDISPDVFSLVRDLLLVIVSGALGAYVTYALAIKQGSKDRILTERVSLYRPLVHRLQDLIDLPADDPDFKGKLKKLEVDLNRFSHELLLYAPDNVYRSYIDAMGTVHRGAKPAAMIAFILSLRRELLGKTDITIEDVKDIQLR